MGINFKDYLDLTGKKDIVALDRTKFKSKKTGGIKFNYEAGIVGENSALTEVKVRETYFNPEDYKVKEGDLSLYCAAMFGGPLY